MLPWFIERGITLTLTLQKTVHNTSNEIPRYSPCVVRFCLMLPLVIIFGGIKLSLGTLFPGCQ